MELHGTRLYPRTFESKTSLYGCLAIFSTSLGEKYVLKSAIYSYLD